MARALTNPAADPTYLDYFGMRRPPFARLSGPSQIFHSEQYSLLMAHLASATEQTDCLMVVCGADGSGKTTLLNRYITGLDEDVSFATFDETCADGTEFYLAFLRQLGFKDITGSLGELRRITKEFLIHRGIAGDPVLVIIDNAHLVSPSVFEQLRWIAETKVEDHRVISIVLAGNSDLPRIMDSPAMKRMQFRSHVDFNIRVFSEEETEDYVRHRLRLAGGADAAKFSSEARPLVYRFSGGIPRLINMLCNEVLTEAFALKTRVITEELIRTVAGKHQLMPHVVPLQGKGRRKTDPDFNAVVPDKQTEERITAREAPPKEPEESAAAIAGMPDIGVKDLLRQVARLSEQLGQLKAENKQALMDIGARDKEIVHLNQAVSNRTKALHKREKAVIDLMAQLEESRKERDSLQTGVIADNDDEITRLNQALADSTEALKKSEDAAINLSAELKASQDECESLQSGVIAENADEITRLNQALSDSGKALRKSEEAAIDLVAQLEESQDKYESLQSSAIADNDKEIVRLNEALSDSSKALQKSEKAAKNDTAKAQTRIEKLDGMASELRAEISDLTIQLRDSQKECESLRSGAIADNDKEIVRLNKALSDSSKAVQKSEKAANKVSADLEKERSARQELTETLGSMESELRAEISDLTGHLKDSQNEFNALLKSEETADKLATDLNDEKRVLEEKIETLGRAKSELRAEVTDLAAELELANKRVAEFYILEESLEESQKECEELRKNEKAADKLAADLKKERSASKIAKTDVAKAKTKIETLNRMKSALQASVSSLTADLRLTNKQADKFNALETSLQESQRECESLRSRVDDLEDLEESISEKDTRIAELEFELASHNPEITASRVQLNEKQAASQPPAPESDSASAPSVGTIATIEVFKGGKIDQVMKIPAGDSRIMVGRGDDSELCLDSKFVSRHHALIFCSSEGAFIEDLNSFNGTVVNLKTITRCELHPDDKVTIGDFQLRPKRP